MQGLRRTRAARAGALFAALAAALAITLTAHGERSHAASAKPNVIVFVTDDQTVRDMLALPRTQAHIGGSGVTFQRSYVSFPLCCPSRVTLQTGQYAHNHGVLGNTAPSGGYELFKATREGNALPVWLQAAGYRTIHIGKMPNGFGTDPTYVPPGWGPFPLKGEFYGFAGPQSAYAGFTLDENGLPVSYGQDEYQTDVYAQKAVKAINDHSLLFPNSPLYMQVQFFAPHDPNTAAVRHQGYFASQPFPTDRSFNEKDLDDKPAWVRRIKSVKGLTTKIATRYRGRLETLLAVDEAINSIMNALLAKEMLTNSYVVFTSDNGFMQGQHRLHQGKFVPYEPSTQVPLLIRGPGIPPGGISNELVSNVDVTSTILDATDAVPGLVQDGRSLLPFAADPNLRTTRPILLETGPPGAIAEVATASGGTRQARISKTVENLDLDGAAQIARAISAPRYRAIRTSRYLLVKYGDGGRELYDMLKDPLQINSVYKDKRYVDVRKFLIKRLASLQPCVGTGCTVEIGIPPKPLKRLKKPPKGKNEKQAPQPG